MKTEGGEAKRSEKWVIRKKEVGEGTEVRGAGELWSVIIIGEAGGARRAGSTTNAVRER